MGAGSLAPFFTMAITADLVKKHFRRFQSRLPITDVSVTIGDTQNVKGTRGTVENANHVNDEGLTNGYLFSVWVEADKFKNETLKPLKTTVNVDDVDYTLLKKSPIPGGVIIRLDIKNEGRMP